MSDTKTAVGKTQEIEQLLARLQLEFVDTARDQLDDIELRIDWLDAGKAVSEDDLFDVQRNVHNIKGQGGTFGHPIVGRIAHMFEDYLENAGGVRAQNVSDMRVYVESMRDALVNEEHLAPAQVEDLLRGLPRVRPQGFSPQETHVVDVLLVMPSGLQRKLVARELLSCGFDVHRAYDTMEALNHALDIAPDIVFANNELTPFTGLELSRVFGGIDRLRDIHFVLFSSYAPGDARLANVPENVSVVGKSKDYTEGLGELLMEWGVFGDIST